MANTNSIRVFLADDHPVFRDGFREIVENEEDFAVAGEVGAGGYMLKDNVHTVLPEAVRKSLRGRVALGPRPSA